MEGYQRVLIENQLDLWQTWAEPHNHQANNNSEKIHVTFVQIVNSTRHGNLDTVVKYEILATVVNDTFTYLLILLGWRRVVVTEYSIYMYYSMIH